ncbi:MAG: hypothetical protein H7A46_01590 [Verrucomicrobiales bacterium]|nr:hypothetical protein [Verrucomicrobiales bacterium]
MKFLFRWIFRLVVLITLLVMGLLLLKNTILEEVVEGELAAATGLRVSMDRLEAGILKPTLTMEGLRFYNPAEFGGAPFVHLREFHMEYDRTALARGRLTFRLLRLDLEELTLVEDTSGRWNYEVVGDQINQLAAGRTEPLDFGGIDMLNLSIGTVKRYRMSAPNEVRTLDFHLHDELFPGLRTPADFLLAAGRLAVKLGLKTAAEAFPTNQPPAMPSTAGG